MSNTPSIEDLMSDDDSGKSKIKDDMTAQEKLAVRMSHISEDQIEASTKRKAAALGVEYVDLKGFAVNAEALRLLPQERAEELKILPFLLIGEELRIAALDPNNEEVIEIAHQIDEREKTHAQIYLTSEQSLKQGLKLYDTLPKIREIKDGVQIEESTLKGFRDKVKTIRDIQPLLKDTTTTNLVALLLAASLEIGSSDVHVEAGKDEISVRYRIDGVLQDIAKIDVERWSQIINRIKLIAGLKLNISKVPQDGRFAIQIDGATVDVRTSTLPTAFGESVVMRLLIPSAINLEFKDLGFTPAAYKKLNAEIIKPHGMIMTTGPTGSGKTTTLYAILNKLNQAEVKIITLEDPIEYKLKGINQSQIDHSKDYTFNKGLRSILRQDPDIVMVGEIRDKETADTAVQAALTGHLLLSTIHTNDAAGAVPRFLSMGVEPALLAPALRVIMGQRLVRRLCKECKEPVTLKEDIKERVKAIVDAIPENSGENPDLSTATFFRAKGCDKCSDSGYKGRVGIYEILIINSAVEEQIRAGSVTDKDMLRIGQEQGMTTMVQDGMLKVMAGNTTLEEVFRVAVE
jgi:type IV pilus assembly protein PilB